MDTSNVTHQDYLDIGASTDRASLERGLVQFANKLDFGIVAAAVAVDQPGQRPIFVMMGNTPSNFLQASKNADDARRDPVMQRMRTSSVPFVYDQGFYVGAGAGDLWEEQAPFGYRTGVSMALHLPGGRHFMLGVDRDEPLPASSLGLTRLMADLQLLGVYAQEAALRILLKDHIGVEVHLTPREREVLLWTRDGKSAWAVGQILGMSDNTVNYHLKNVMAKLDATSKHQAVLKAIQLGLI